MVEIKSSFISKGSKNRPAYANPKFYITIHNTGNISKGSGARNHASYVKSAAAQAIPVSWHLTVDDKEAYQHLPFDESAYHAGDGNGDGNRKSIGIEICMNSDGDLLKATDNAVEIVAYLCNKYSIATKDIRQHYDWSKKNCPQMIREGKPYDWNTFISKVQNLLSGGGNNGTGELPIAPSPKGEMYRVRKEWHSADTQEGAFEVLDNAKNLADKLNAKPEYFVFNSKGEKVYP